MPSLSFKMSELPRGMIFSLNFFEAGLITDFTTLIFFCGRTSFRKLFLKRRIHLLASSTRVGHVCWDYYQKFCLLMQLR
jgi:hypothetical protein